METSEQAISDPVILSAGLLFGMAASLVLTPVCYAIFHDKRCSSRQLRKTLPHRERTIASRSSGASLRLGESSSEAQ